MSADGFAGDLPPHELRALLGSIGAAGEPIGAPRPPGPALATGSSPGIGPAALPGAPVTVPDDSTAIGLAIARIVSESLGAGAGGAALGPVAALVGPPAPERLAAAASPPASPGLAPTLVPAPPAAAGAGLAPPGDPLAPPSDPLAALLLHVERLPLLGDAAPSGALAPPPLERVPLFELGAGPAPAAAAPAPAQPHAAAPRVRELGGTAFDPHAVRRDFPILEERVHGDKRLVWLDNAATTQKPRAVIDRLARYYEHENSNVHRAAHALAARATDAYEGARETTRRFLNAPSASDIVFVRGATEGINLVAKAWGRRHIGRGDEIVLTHLEHHANIVPWQQLCTEVGARLRVAPVDDRGDVILEEYERLLCARTRLVAFTQVSNALGTVTPAREMIEIAHRWGAAVLLDGAQAVSHMPVDVQALDCDFYVLSGHKVFAPTGIGAVYGKAARLAEMPPWQGGGNMIRDVTFERTVYQDPPWRFEAGTGNIADAAGMGAALDYVMRLGMASIERYEHELLVYATEQLRAVPGLRMIGAPRHKAGVLSFVLDGQRTEDVGAALDQDGIAVRSGHHCAQPILRRFGHESSVRASLAFYNVPEDIDALVRALRRLQGGGGRHPL